MRRAMVAGTDETLYDAWRSGDNESGRALFERHFDALFRFFENKAGGGDVADLVQRTFLACVEARDRFRGASSFRTFLYSIARHELSGFYRARRRGAAVDFGVSSVADLGATPSTLVRQRSEHAALSSALQSLPVDLQIAVELRFWEGLSGPELAAVLDVAEGTVRSRLRRALEGLRDALASSTEGARLCPEHEADLEAWAAQLAATLKHDEPAHCSKQ